MAKKKEKLKVSLTLVWEYRGSKVFIDWDINKAKQYSDYMNLGQEAINMLEQLDLQENFLDNNKKKWKK
jgi:hypothetical protein